MVHSVVLGLAVIIWCVFAATSRRRSTPRAGSRTSQACLLSLHHNTAHSPGLDGQPHGHHYGGGHLGCGGMHHG
jgi:hypothetical protein